MSKPVELIQVHKTYPDGTQALKGIDLSIQSGEFVAIVGPSGCGKSSLLNLIAGLEPLSQGSIQFGQNTSSLQAGDIAYIFQDPCLLPWASIWQNINLPLKLNKTPNPQRLEELIKLVGLEEFSQAYPDQLSGGMKMRASIARAYVSQPSILLMDEPFAALDEMTRSQMGHELIKLKEKIQSTTVFITHHIQEAITLADRVLVMSARPGRIIAQFDIQLEHRSDPNLKLDPEFLDYTKAITAAVIEKAHA